MVANGCKRLASCLNLLHIPQLLLHVVAVSAKGCIAPCYNSSGFQNGSKSTCFGRWISRTFLSRCCTWLLSPPQSGFPRDNMSRFQNCRKQWQLRGFAGHSSVVLALFCCPRQNLPHPMSQPCQIPEWQQKRCWLLEVAGHSSAALAPGCCLRRRLDNPMSQQLQIAKWLPKHLNRSFESAERSSAALPPVCCFRRGLDYPMSLQLQFPQWQQKRYQLLGLAGHASAALANDCCLDSTRPWISPRDNSSDSKMAAKAPA